MNYIKFILHKYKQIFLFILPFVLTILLNGCNSNDLVLMNSKGDIGLEERSLILVSFGLMLIIVVPVIIMTFIFSIKYRSSNIDNTKYDPNWDQSKKIEFIIWFVPIIIIILLSIITWKSTHQLDPRKPIINTLNPIVVNVIALDWKWLFIYPQQNIAVINELVFPVHVPVKFNITSNSVMNSFFIPQLGSQIYAMAGMSTQLHLIANTPGKYKGISSNFSGSGFSGMKFTVIATKNEEEFNRWIHQAQMSMYHINDFQSYEALAKPSQFNSVRYFSNIQSNLFYEVINKFLNHKKEYHET